MVARIEALRYPLDDEKRYSPIAVFRQLISQGRIKFNFGVVSFEPKEDDLRRVHDIINEIDNRRAFYNSMEDEIPAPVVESIRAAKQKFNELRQGLWADPWARQVVQILLDDLGDFLTKIERFPLAKDWHDARFGRLEKHLVELRLRVWTAVAHFVVVFGDAVKPLHLPPEILEEVQRAYKAR
jgi:hypothetical protein